MRSALWAIAWLSLSWACESVEVDAAEDVVAPVPVRTADPSASGPDDQSESIATAETGDGAQTAPETEQAPSGATHADARTRDESASRQSRTVTMREGTRAHPAPEDAPVGVVHVPAGFDPEAPFELVVFSHGWNGCVDVLARSGEVRCRPPDVLREGWGLAAAHDGLADPQLLLYLPQLAYRARRGEPGDLRDDAVANAMLDEALAAAEAPRAGLQRIWVVSHSAGFRSALAMLQVEGWPVAGVVLFDSLYGQAAGFAEWLIADSSRRLLSIYAPDSTTESQSRRLRSLMGPFGRDARQPRWPARARAVTWVSEVRHREMPATLWSVAVRTLRDAHREAPPR